MREFWVTASLLWFAGAGLRLTILAVPPVIALIQHDLNLSGTEIGILSGLPVVLFGLAALPGSLLIARFGALPTVVAGLMLAGVASGLRGAFLDVWWLYAMTILMSAGVAVMQPALPPLVRAWLPKRVSFGTALYTNGLLVGETIPVMLTLPLLFPLLNDSWRWSFVVWGIPLIVIALATRALAPPVAPAAAPLSGGRRWWPNWRNPLIWQLGIMFGCVNCAYFCSNAFLPGYLTWAGRPDLISGALTALNFGQLPASFIMMAFARQMERKVWPFVLSGVVLLVCFAGIVMTASLWTLLFAGILGFTGAVILTLGFALPALLGEPADVARMSAAMFTISYTEGLVVAILSGAAWDIAGSAAFAFLPIAIASLPLLIIPWFIPFNRVHAGTAH
jgi:CP family cyanate transporter-like MFS transporter